MHGHWLDRAAWRLRSPELATLVVEGDQVAMVLDPPRGADPAAWRSTCERWLALPASPTVLEAVALDAEQRLHVRYAVLDPEQRRFATDQHAAQQIASWGIRLARAYEMVADELDDDELGWLTSPMVRYDVEGYLRLGFWPGVSSAGLAPEVRARWPRCDERGLVHLVGRLMAEHPRAGDAPLGAVIARCLDATPRRRYQTLSDLCAALRNAGGRVSYRDEREAAEWSEVEAGVGLLAAGEPGLAIRRLEVAVRREPTAGAVVRLALEHARVQLTAPVVALPPVVAPPPALDSRRSWPEVEREGAALERDRAFERARRVYAAVPREPAFAAAIETALARCHLELGDAGAALAAASRALEADPDHRDALALAIAAWLRARDAEPALAAADRLVALAPDDDTAHYLRGKCLLALGRLVEARAAFDRAPRRLDAILLRREVDRCLRKIRVTVGERDRVPIDPDDPLAELQRAVLGGRTGDAIAALQTAAYADDAVAQLLLAECLVTERRLDDALAIYDRATALGAPPTLGKARALLELGRAGEALALAERADDAEALELRVRSLRALGRLAEADVVERRLVELAGDRSELRLQSQKPLQM